MLSEESVDEILDRIECLVYVLASKIGHRKALEEAQDVVDRAIQDVVAEVGD